MSQQVDVESLFVAIEPGHQIIDVIVKDCFYVHKFIPPNISINSYSVVKAKFKKVS